MIPGKRKLSSLAQLTIYHLPIFTPALSTEHDTDHCFLCYVHSASTAASPRPHAPPRPPQRTTSTTPSAAATSAANPPSPPRPTRPTPPPAVPAAPPPPVPSETAPSTAPPPPSLPTPIPPLAGEAAPPSATGTRSGTRSGLRARGRGRARRSAGRRARPTAIWKSMSGSSSVASRQMRVWPCMRMNLRPSWIEEKREMGEGEKNCGSCGGSSHPCFSFLFFSFSCTLLHSSSLVFRFQICAMCVHLCTFWLAPFTRDR